jgi:hydroxymethylglutaryl-CoA lyase
MLENKIELVECPRDAMQGMKDFVPTELKINYINHLLACNFDIIDFGSFVSPKAIPQMRDTAEVLNGLNLNNTTKLLAIIANERGAEDAVQFEEITYLGYPFSVSEEFQKRNTNASIEESLHRVEAIQNMCVQNNKELVLYLSMGFGNPYGEAWSPDLVFKWSEKLYEIFGVKILALSDTIGCATPDIVSSIFKEIIPSLKEVTFGAHLHTTKENAKALVEAAIDGGCKRFDGAIKGFGGCPMAKDDLTGNMPMELILSYLNDHQLSHAVKMKEFQTAFDFSNQIFH